MTALSGVFVGLVLVVVALVLVGVHAVARRAQASTRPALLAAAAVVGWLALTGVFAHLGLFAFHPARPPLVLVLVWLPILATLAAARTARGRILVAATPAAWLIGLQGFRVGVELILWRLHAEGLMPARMTFEGRNFDILVGATAPAVAWLASRGRLPRWGEAAWHLASLCLLVNVVSLAMLSVPSPARRYFDDVPLTIPATLPWVWLPAVLVPFALLSHVLGLVRLARLRAVSSAASEC